MFLILYYFFEFEESDFLAVEPEFFQVVELPCLLVHKVDYHIAAVKQNPPLIVGFLMMVEQKKPLVIDKFVELV